jgi:pantetheine-phosphate adenylyltransferase
MTQYDMHIAVYTGSFDPITLGHLNVIQRCSRLVDRLIIGIGSNVEKEALFSVEDRLDLVRQTTAELKNIEIRVFDGLAVDFVSGCRARVMIRGVRSLSDMESEFTMSLANRKLAPDIETVFLMAGEEYSHISSSLIKQIAALAGEKELQRFVPHVVAKALRERLSEFSGS